MAVSSFILISSFFVKNSSRIGTIFFLVNSSPKSADKFVINFILNIFLKIILLLSLFSSLLINSKIFLNNSSLYLDFINILQHCKSRSNNKSSCSFFSSSVIIIFLGNKFFLSGFNLFLYNCSIIFKILFFIISIPSSPNCSKNSKKFFNFFKK